MAQTWILSLSLIIQLTAAALAIRLIFVTGKRFAWGALALAILLMSARRALSLFELAGSNQPAAAAPEVVALGISILVLVAVVSIKPVFDDARGFNQIERRLGRILDSSLHEIFIFAAGDLRFIRVNHGARDNLGYSMEELTRLTPVDLKPEFDEATFRDKIDPLVRGELERLRFLTRHRRKDGTEYPVEVDLQMTREPGECSFIAVVHDVSERVQAAEALARSEAHFRSLIENAQDIITVLDEHGTIRYHSPSVERVLGYRPEERVGRSSMESVHPDDAEATIKTLRAVLSTPDAHSLTYRVRHEDGSWRTLEAIGRARRGADGSPEVVVNQRDVTERAQVEAQLLRAQKLETIGTLAGGIAHDFNNFLTPILGYVELIKAASKGDPPEGLDEIRVAGERAKQLVRQILTFSRQTETERRPICFASTLGEAIALARSTLPSNVTIQSKIAAEIGFVMSDPTQIHQVVMNICTNAKQAMEPDGGTLTIEVDREEVCAGGPEQLAAGSYVTLILRDTGRGMGSEVAERVFEPFFTTKSAAEGTGLGLSVAHGIVASHGGDMTVESAPGRGTEFRIRLPRIEGTPETREEEALDASGTERILLVDDEEAVGRYMTTMLGSLGYEVTNTSHPDEALELLRRSLDSFDLVITDLTMPGMSGLQLATRVKQLRGDLPIIVMSGNSGDLGTEAEMSGIIDATLAKPFRADDLGRAIRQARNS